MLQTHDSRMKFAEPLQRSRVAPLHMRLTGSHRQMAGLAFLWSLLR
jgi:hypothetical protein